MKYYLLINLKLGCNYFVYIWIIIFILFINNRYNLREYKEIIIQWKYLLVILIIISTQVFHPH